MTRKSNTYVEGSTRTVCSGFPTRSAKDDQIPMSPSLSTRIQQKVQCTEIKLRREWATSKVGTYQSATGAKKLGSASPGRLAELGATKGETFSHEPSFRVLLRRNSENLFIIAAETFP